MRDRLFAPTSRRPAQLSSGEAARLVGVSDGYLRPIVAGGRGTSSPRWAPAAFAASYSLADIDALRHYLAEQALSKGNTAKARSYVDWRDPPAENICR